jgi:hypothetical protein
VTLLRRIEVSIAQATEKDLDRVFLSFLWRGNWHYGGMLNSHFFSRCELNREQLRVWSPPCGARERLMAGLPDAPLSTIAPPNECSISVALLLRI